MVAAVATPACCGAPTEPGTLLAEVASPVMDATIRSASSDDTPAARSKMRAASGAIGATVGSAGRSDERICIAACSDPTCNGTAFCVGTSVSAGGGTSRPSPAIRCRTLSSPMSARVTMPAFDSAMRSERCCVISTPTWPAHTMRGVRSAS